MANKKVNVEVDPRCAKVPAKYRACLGGVHAFPDIAEGPGEHTIMRLATDWQTVLIHRTCRRCGTVKFEERYSSTGQRLGEPTYSDHPEGYLADRGTGRRPKADFIALSFAELFPKAIRA